MTFEDFFIKKRIDLRQLQQAEPLLYEEFKSHYESMGEKSFDHTKKYWFNRLRKSFHLQEAVIAPTPVAGSTVSSAQRNTPPSEEISSLTTKPTGFKPRFKAAKPQTTSESTAENIPKTSVETSNQKPTGFKPRFKAGQVTAKAPDDMAQNKTLAASRAAKEETTGQTSESAKADSRNEEKPNNALTPVSKPTGFKPRFKAGVTKPTNLATEKVTVSDDQGTEKPAVKKEATSQTPEQTRLEKDNPENEDRLKKETAPVSKPTGFKPRFKAGVTKPANPTTEKTTVSDRQNTVETAAKEEAAPQQPKQENENENSSKKTSTSISKPIGFKPRFKPNNKNESGNNT